MRAASATWSPSVVVDAEGELSRQAWMLAEGVRRAGHCMEEVALALRERARVLAEVDLAEARALRELADLLEAGAADALDLVVSTPS